LLATTVLSPSRPHCYYKSSQTLIAYKKGIKGKGYSDFTDADYTRAVSYLNMTTATRFTISNGRLEYERFWRICHVDQKKIAGRRQNRVWTLGLRLPGSIHFLRGDSLMSHLQTKKSQCNAYQWLVAGELVASEMSEM